MDRPYFLAARQLLLDSGRDIGYAIGMSPAALANCADSHCINWDGKHDVTCQVTAVVADHGTAAAPEKYYHQHALSGLPRLLFERHVSQEMTRRVVHVRRGKQPQGAKNDPQNNRCDLAGYPPGRNSSYQCALLDQVQGQ